MELKPFETFNCDGPSDYTIETNRDELLDFYRTMQTIRRIEVAADNAYKEKLIKGFLHLYNGQVSLHR